MLTQPDPSGATDRVETSEVNASSSDIARSEARFHALAQQVGEIFWTASVNQEDHQMEAWCAFTGQDPETITLNQTLEAVHPDDRDKMRQAIAEGCATKRPLVLQFRVRRADGVYRLLSSRAVPILNTDGSLREFAGIATDITPENDSPATGILTGPLTASDADAESPATPDAGEERVPSFHLLVHESLIGVVLANEDRIVDANTTFLALLGYSRNDVRGKSLTWRRLTPETEPSLDERMRHDLLEHGGCRPFECVLKHRDGHPVYVLLGADLIQVQPLQWAGYIVDITGRRDAEQAMRALQEVTDSALAHLQVDDLLRDMLERTRVLLHADNIAVLLADHEKNALTIRATRGFGAEMTMRVFIPIGKGFAGRIAATRAPVIVEDVTKFDVVSPFLREKLASAMGVPLLVGERLIGVLHVGNEQHRKFTPHDVELLQQAADRIALALDRAQLYEAAQKARWEATERASQLEATFDALMDAVVILNPMGNVVRANAAAHQLFASIGLDKFDEMSIEERSRKITLWDSENQLLARDSWPVYRVLNGETIHGTASVDVQIKAVTGHTIRLNTTGAPVLDPAGRSFGAVLVYRDVTETHLLERRTHDALSALLAMAEALVEPPGNEGGEISADQTSMRTDIAHRLAALTCDVLGCSRVGIMAIEPETQLLRPAAVVGLTPDQTRQWWQDQETHASHFGEGADPDLIARFVVGEALVVDMRESPYNAQPNPYGSTTSLAAPMRIGDTLVGILSLDYGGPPHAFTGEEMSLAAAVAKLAALAIERERLLREREEARADSVALRRANQRMDEFLHVVNHELSTPLTSIKSNIQLAQRRLVGYTTDAATVDPDVRLSQFTTLQTLLERTESQVNRLSRLLSDLVDASRVETGKLDLRMEPCDIVPLINECVEVYRQLHAKRRIELQQSAAHAWVEADSDRINQVITNYLSNAVKYSPPDKPIYVSLETIDHQVRIAVRDEGPGLPPQEQKRIWQRFHQAAGVVAQGSGGVGLGLGLYISKQIIVQHGGEIGVTSEAGRGCTFWFQLPLSQPAP